MSKNVFFTYPHIHYNDGQGTGVFHKIGLVFFMNDNI